jgi:ATP-binding cassette subfamily B protein
MMSRLNNDVSGAQRAVTGNLVSLVTNIISLISTLVVMISLEWPLTLVLQRDFCPERLRKSL